MTNFTQAILRLSNKDNYADIYDLKFDLIQSSFLPKWIDRYLEAKQRQDPISEPWAFYNLNNDWTPEYTVEFLNYHIDQCNLLSPNMFKHKLLSISDQDTLNQIHSVFELHHGKLDKWMDNPLLKDNTKLREHLSHVNQAVHRCESSNKQRGKIRVVFFDLPKIKKFTELDYSLFTNSIDFGGLYTLYADVGKSLDSLAQDNDGHHHDFVPYLHYSVDCSVKFYDDSGSTVDHLCKKFINENWKYFEKKGYRKDDPVLTSTGAIKLGQLKYISKQQVLDRLKNYNYIQDLILY